jgi:hypothetical protein
MNPTDHYIDQVLYTLGTAEAPSGLEQRLTARLGQLAQTPTPRRAFFAALRNGFAHNTAPASLYIAASAITAIVLVTVVATHHSSTSTTAQSTHAPSFASSHVAQDNARLVTSNSEIAQTAIHSVRTATQESLLQTAVQDEAASSRGSIPTPADLDAIALAETLAPSHPAPPQPLTAQEALLVRATRRGQPIEIAEFDAAREPVLRAIAAQRERTNISQYVHALLAPLAAAEALNPTPPPDEPTPSSTSESPSSK